MFEKNKPFFIFLAKFALSYLIFSGIYWLYLSQYNAEQFEADGMTRIVAEQSRDVSVFLGEEARIRLRKTEASYMFYINDKRVARVVEGCNAVSVMILFAAFVIAFSSSFKRTSLYILSGLILIHILNVIRVALICMGVYYYPQYAHFLHDVVFPLFIYGVVFALWVAWVIKFRNNEKKVAA